MNVYAPSKYADDIFEFQHTPIAQTPKKTAASLALLRDYFSPEGDTVIAALGNFMTIIGQVEILFSRRSE